MVVSNGILFYVHLNGVARRLFCYSWLIFRTPFHNQCSSLTLNSNNTIAKLIIFSLIADTPQQKGFVNFFKSLPEVRTASIMGRRTVA
jgi:hypothetical protein